jgi:hypothetical protein
METLQNVRWGVVIAAVLTVLGSLIITPNVIEHLNADELMVIQSVGGTLTCYTEPGWKAQNLGRITKYPRRATYDFSETDADRDNSKKLRFNDGGHANMYGSVNWEMPLDCPRITAIHKNFGSAAGIESKGVAQMVDLAVYLSGPLMSSTESSGERRSELTQLINDQAQNGVYQTRTKNVEKPDPITGERKQVAEVEIQHAADGQPMRQQGSILKEYGIQLLPISIKEIRYDNIVEAQIAERQKATTQVQIAIANARKAEQDAITIAKQGEAAAAEARWKQETIKAQQVTEAEQKLRVAELAAQEAAAYKREQVLRGEGEAARRQLVMRADGALDKKLEAYIKVQEVWADAFAKFGGSMVPSVVMGSGAGGQSAVGTAQTFLELMTARAAKDLGVDMGVTGRNRTAATQPAKE